MEEPRPQRRPKTRAGTHATLHGYPRPTLLCNETVHPVWFTRTGPRCDHCWHHLDTLQATSARHNLAAIVRAIIGNHTGLVADDLDDSTEGLKLMSKTLVERLPFLRLSPTPRQRALFRIATTIHTLHAVDDDPERGYEETREEMRALSTKIDTEITELVKVAVK